MQNCPVLETTLPWPDRAMATHTLQRAHKNKHVLNVLCCILALIMFPCCIDEIFHFRCFVNRHLSYFCVYGEDC